jgi:hypothetical protein
VADLGDGQVALALLERLDHGQATGQGGHEVRVTGKGLDALGREATIGGAMAAEAGARLRVAGIVAQGFVTHRTPQKKRRFVRLSNKRPIIAIDRRHFCLYLSLPLVASLERLVRYPP